MSNTTNPLKPVDEIEKLKNKVAISKGFPNWQEMENWIIDNNLPVSVAVLLVGAMYEVAVLAASKESNTDCSRLCKRCNQMTGPDYCEGCENDSFEDCAWHITEAEIERIKNNKMSQSFLACIEENYQAQIAGFYNDDKTDEERKIRNAVIDEYEDLIAIYKSKYLPANTDCSVEQAAKEYEGGWKYEPEWLRQLTERINQLTDYEETVSMEQAEAVLIAINYPQLKPVDCSVDGWISVENGLPDIDTPVYVRTEYMSSGKPMVDYFMGYMDEYGDTIICPNDESYGWQFNDCVTHWRPVPPLPTPPNTEQPKNNDNE